MTPTISVISMSLRLLRNVYQDILSATDTKPDIYLFKTEPDSLYEKHLATNVSFVEGNFFHFQHSKALLFFTIFRGQYIFFDNPGLSLQ